mmetsp:Transcript_25271/g.60832  ORF Transcript_25271/g.60832 Transcript_25271/m.60832 type:complete len:1011 (-) Transcript_25271:196-3228(-)|eukprot:CAMPEP_0114505552 /NCGR_PEP_ID=MMETSP0109-20121206/10915_1 /TAXON_ID=29199 /ORGANISM="Chlorarachnion reptans, Strain CCCM449" /LENGTH=1010 /DNA_ID=CAMNT_0001684001 /DNA_START=337 /DNA_END=3369 /DNA_ORIENTATION=+
MWKASEIRGLTNAEVLKSLSKFGSNELPAPKQPSFWEKFKENFDDPLIHILCVSLGVIFVLAMAGYADFMEGGGIGLSIIISTLVATYSEFKNENSFRLLQEKASKIRTLCLRGPDGTNPVQVAIDKLVSGDVVILQGGDRVPADGNVILGSVLVDQSSLNGEKIPVEKKPREAKANDRQCDQDDLGLEHRVFRGSVVEEGEAMMRIDALGSNTVFGRLAVDLTSGDKRKQPLKMKLEALAQTIAHLSYAGSIAIAVSFLFKQLVIDNHFSWEEIKEYVSKVGVLVHDCVTAVILGIIVVVCAVPEGLPTMIAVVLSLNMSRLLEDQVLVRHLLGIETSGCLEVLFTDKTGTITEGSFSPETFVSSQLQTYTTVDEMTGGLGHVLQFSIEASSSTVVRRDSKTGNLSFFGSNATDASILKYLYKHRDMPVLGDNSGPAATELKQLRKELDRQHLKILVEVRFTSTTKFSARRVSFKDGSYHFVSECSEAFKHFYVPGNRPGIDGEYRMSIVRGAPEILLGKCPHGMDKKGGLHALDKFEQDRIQARVNELSSYGQRLVAIAVTREELKKDSPPDNLILLGVMCLVDKIRPSSIRCMKYAAQAGVQVIMVTGDKSETAVAVARDVGLIGNYCQQDMVLTSQELRAMSDKKLANILPKLAVVARALPSDKSRLVRVAQNLGGGAGKVVGMTGDGINDSAALKKADVSFAMGNGAEVAKEASDIVILDNQLSSIISAILYGRSIFKTIRKFIMFQSTINFASTFIVFIGPFMGFDFPLTLIQLLWVNLVMDTLAALAFGGEPADASFLMEPPLPRDQPIISGRMCRSIFSNGFYIACCSVAFLMWDQIQGMFDRNIEESLAPVDLDELDFKETAKVEDVRELKIQGGPVFLTAFFSFFIFICTFNAFNVRTPSLSLGHNITKNRGFLIVIGLIFVLQISFCQYGGSLLRTVPLSLREWTCLLAMSITIIPFDMVRKILFESEGISSLRRRDVEEGSPVQINLDVGGHLGGKQD